MKLFEHPDFQPAILAGMAGSVAYSGRVITPGW